MESTGRDRRGFYRLEKSLIVTYRFVGNGGTDSQFKKVCKGKTKNISTTGILLIGAMPKPEWISDLLTQKIIVALSINMPGKGKAIKAIGRLAWLDVTLSEEDAQYEMGIFFKEISEDDKERIVRFIIESVI